MSKNIKLPLSYIVKSNSGLRPCYGNEYEKSQCKKTRLSFEKVIRERFSWKRINYNKEIDVFEYYDISCQYINYDSFACASLYLTRNMEQNHQSEYLSLFEKCFEIVDSYRKNIINDRLNKYRQEYDNFLEDSSQRCEDIPGGLYHLEQIKYRIDEQSQKLNEEYKYEKKSLYYLLSINHYSGYSFLNDDVRREIIKIINDNLIL